MSSTFSIKSVHIWYVLQSIQKIVQIEKVQKAFSCTLHPLNCQLISSVLYRYSTAVYQNAIMLLREENINGLLINLK